MSEHSKSVGRAAFMHKFETSQSDLFDRVAAHVNPDGDRLVQCCLEATFGRGPSLNCLLGSNGIERLNLAYRIASHANELARANDYQMAVVVFRDTTWAFEPEASVCDLPLIRKVNNDLKKLGEAAIAAVQVGCLPRATAQFEYAPQVKAAVFGKDLEASLPGAIRRLDRKFQCPGEPAVSIEWPHRQSVKARFTQVARLFDLRDPQRARARATLDNEQLEQWKAATTERMVRRYQVLTMSLLDRMVMATGELAPILEGATREGISRARKLYRASDKPLHRDQIVHFWLERQLQSNNPYVLPFVKVR